MQQTICWGNGQIVISTDHRSHRLKKHTPTGLHFNLENHHISDFTIQPIEQICATNNNALMIRRNRELLWQRLLHTSHPIGFNNTASMNTSNWKYLSTTIPIPTPRISRNTQIDSASCLFIFNPNLTLTLTLDHLRLLCIVVNVCRETARRPRYKFLANW